MPDITMCNGTNCPLKDTFYRHKAIPNEHLQSYFITPPFKQKMSGVICDPYWKTNR